MIEARISEAPVFGAGLAALTDGALALLVSDALPHGEQLTVHLTHLDEDGEETNESIEARTFADVTDVERHRASLLELVDRSVADGQARAGRIGELFPGVLLGQRARDQIAALSGAEPYFRQLVAWTTPAGAARACACTAASSTAWAASIAATSLARFASVSCASASQSARSSASFAARSVSDSSRVRHVQGGSPGERRGRGALSRGC